MMHGHDKIMRLEDFDQRDNDFCGLFAGHLTGRRAFVQRWETLQNSGMLIPYYIYKLMI
jgi:hypothetical protein